MATQGFKYFFDIHMGVGRAADELLEVKVGDKTAWRGSVTTNSVTAIAAPELFGGTTGEGGVEGSLTAMFGGTAQTAPAAMVTTFGGPLPGFRGAFTLFFSGLVSAMNPYPKPWSFRYRRALQGWDGAVWYPAKAVISIVRPVAAGELAEGSTEAKTITVSEDFTPTLAAGGTVGVGPWQYTIVSAEPIITITEVYVSQGYGLDYTKFALVLGTDYTVAGNVLTFVPGLIAAYEDQSVHVAYTKSIQSVAPIGSTLGTTLIQSMNAAHIIYECMTNREWGRGLPRTQLDDVSFTQVADALFAEGFGLCLRWRRRDEIRTFVQSVLDHIGGVMFTSRTTGLLVLRLIRSDYDQDTMTLYDTENGLLEISEASIGAAAKMISELRVTYRDPVTNEDRVVRASNLAATRSAGGTINMLSKEYPGIPTAELASRAAKRDIRSTSPKLRRFTLTFDRRANKLEPGGVVRIQDLPRNIPDMVLRIATIDYGSSRDGKIKVQAVQDVFGTPRNGFTVIGPPAWAPPPQRACVGMAMVYELPYRTLYRKLNTADFAVVAAGSAYLGLAQDKGTGSNANGVVGMAVKYGAQDENEYPTADTYFCGMAFNPPITCDPQWSDVQLLCNFEGATDTTLPTVYSDYGNILQLTSNGPASTSTGDYKFGTRGAKIVGNSGAMVVSAPIGWVGCPSAAPRDKEFCVELWAKFESYAAGAEVIKFGYNGTTQKYSALYYDFSIVGGFYVTALIAIGNQQTVATGIGIPIGAWFHLAWDRRAGTSRIFVNGSVKASWADSYNYDVDTVDIRTPASSVNGSTGVVFYDELRYTVGSSRYGADFTPPVKAFKTVACAPIQKLRLIQPARSLPPFSILAPTNLTHKVLTDNTFASSVFKPGFVRSRYNNTTVAHTGKKYCEFQIIGAGDSATNSGRGYAVGLVQDSADNAVPSNPLGGTTAAYFSNINYFGGTPGVGGGAGGVGVGLGDFAQNNVVGMAVDYATGGVWFRVGTGAWIGGGNPATGAAPSVVLGAPANALPYMTVYARTGAQNFEVRMRAQGDTMTGVIPTGFAIYS